MDGKETNPIRLKKNTKIGELDAESDSALLSDCFVELPEFSRASDLNDAGSIILGRVGSGKSAVILRMKDHCKCFIWLEPESLAFQYLENSTMLKFVEALGVNLNTFYKLLWRHVLVVELLKKRFQITDSRVQYNFFDSLASKFGLNEKRKKAIEYVKEWGDKFWEETESRVKEVTRKFESQLSASLGGDNGSAKLSIEGNRNLSTEQKEELFQRATKVVNEVQIRKLAEVLDLLGEAELLGDPQKEFHILIDGLDSNWASTPTRCKLIRALIEEIKTFRKLPTVKIVIALRRDLLSLVYNSTRDSGFQEEKYEALLIELRWSDDDLKRLVEQRLQTVFERQYSKTSIGIENIFPSVKGGGITPIEYMLQRTLRRPREIIQFVNEAMKIAENKSKVSLTDIRKAENVYSEKRVNSLFEEWSDIYPSLSITIELLRGAPARVTPSYFYGLRLQNLVANLLDGNPNDPCVRDALMLSEPKSQLKESDAFCSAIQCLYQIGVIGIKTDSNDSLCYSWKDQPTISKGEVSRCVKLQIHRMIWQALNIMPDETVDFA